MITSLKEEEANRAMEVPRPDVSHLVTEDDTPVDNLFHEKQMRLLTHPLYASWDPGQPFGAMANVGLFISTHVPPLVPDVLVTLGVPVPPPAAITRKDRGSYFMWLYGKAPDIVVEIVSNKEGGELDRKREGYARFTVPYYVVFDPDLFIQDRKLRPNTRKSKLDGRKQRSNERKWKPSAPKWRLNGRKPRPSERKRRSNAPRLLPPGCANLAWTPIRSRGDSFARIEASGDRHRRRNHAEGQGTAGFPPVD